MALFYIQLPPVTFLLAWDRMPELAGVAAIPISIVAAWFSRRSVVEMQEQRMSSSRPQLMARRVDQSDEYQKSGNFEVEVENIGTGPAFDVIAAIRHKQLNWSDGVELELNCDSKVFPIFYLERRYPIRVAEKPRIDSRGELRLTYRDRFGREWITRQDIDFNVDHPFPTDPEALYLRGSLDAYWLLHLSRLTNPRTQIHRWKILRHSVENAARRWYEFRKSVTQ